MKTLFMVMALLFTLMSVTSCNMLRGAGEDIEDAGSAIKDAAN